MPHFDWKILLLVLSLPCCENRQSVDSQLFVSAKSVSLRVDPSEKSREISALIQNQRLVDLGEVSQTESQTAVGAQLYQTPWIKVQTPDNQIGWVLAWALKPVQKQKDWLLQKRMDCYFGKTLTKRRNAVIHSLAELKTEQQLFDLWRDSNVLRDTFLQLISSRPEGDFKLQFKWLEEVLPGFIYQKNEIENQPELFADFLFWQQNTLKTNGLQDDAFFQTCLLAFSKDSIESFFPAWKFQLSETESASQLGTGQHLKMLQRIDQSHQTGTLFAVLLTTFKEQILADIFEKGVRYWQPKEKILDELGQILAHPPKCLSRHECEALAIRQKMFKDPVGNGIVVNLRSGE